MCIRDSSHTLSISSLLPEHNGSYKCRVSTEYCSVISNAAELKGKQLVGVCQHSNSSNFLTHTWSGIEPVKIIKHPQTQCKVYGSDVTLTLSATGPGSLLYQWMKDEEAIIGACNSTYHIESFSYEHSGRYKCQVSNEDCSLISNSAKLEGNLPC